MTPDPELLEDIEDMAVELANLAGAEIRTALGRVHSVRYKDEFGTGSLEDPVSEADHHIESLIRSRLADRFPEHDIIGEELDERPGRDHDFVWAVDPIDGTANFINGFPLFAASIGVLHRGAPVVGAVWCSGSHQLRPGVYHARHGSPLKFEGEVCQVVRNATIRRSLVALPSTPTGDSPWQVRKTGSAAIECAFVSCGLLRAARFATPNLWDVAGGVALVAANGGTILGLGNAGWKSLTCFEPHIVRQGAPPDLRHWRRPLIVGEPEVVGQLRGLES